MSFKITTTAREYGEGEGHGVSVRVSDKCLEIYCTNKISSWYVGRVVDEFGTCAMLKLGRFWIEYTSGLDNT